MTDFSQQIEAIEKEIRETPYHKGTEEHFGLMRARLARLKDRLLEATTRKSGGGGGYAVKKQGDATVVLIGPPSAGKSTLINKLTNAQSKVAPYAFTTVSVIPGMLKYNDAYIQILDVPGLIEGAEEGKGRGREVLSVARGADLIVIMTDVKRIEALERIAAALHRNGIRLNTTKPKARIEKKMAGGLIVHSNIKQDLAKETVAKVAGEFGIKNAEITIEEKLTLERLIDAFSPSRVYIPAFFVVNKADMATSTSAYSLMPSPLSISAEKEEGLSELKEKMWEFLGLTRIYLIKGDEEPHKNDPMIVGKDSTLGSVAQKIGPEFAEGKVAAKIWGESARFPGQEVSLTTTVSEGLQIRFI